MVLRKRARHLEHFSRDLSSLNVWKSRRSSFRGDFWRLLLFLYGHKCRVNDSGTVKIVDIHQVFRFKQAHVRLFSNTFNTFGPNRTSFQKCISSFIFKVFQVIWESLLCHKPALDWVIKLLLRFYVHSTDATDMTRHFFPDAIIFPISQNQKTLGAHFKIFITFRRVSVSGTGNGKRLLLVSTSGEQVKMSNDRRFKVKMQGINMKK